MKNGIADRPISSKNEDLYDIESYMTGLGEFIKECQTPMTVAVQGDWGCGKTSMMNMVKDYIGEDTIPIWFNTWQFSQFDMDSELSTLFLLHLIKELDNVGSSKTTKAKRELADGCKKIIKSLISAAVTRYLGDAAGKITEDKLSGQVADKIDNIIELKKNFSELINEVTQDSQKRVVIFIDDLDRLQPVHAVELLEVLKLFVDCENCVFVLAIDTSVVFQGIREKYGQDISNDKAQSFFDKMIQLPFKMPVANYKLDKSIIDMINLERKGFGETDIKECIRLVKKASDGNPRSIKRIVNFYMLTEKVAEKKELLVELPDGSKVIANKILLAFACIQLRYEKVYNFFLKDISNNTVQLIKQANNVPVLCDSDRYERICRILSKMNIQLPEIEKDKENDFADVIIIFLNACRKLLNSDLTNGQSGLNRSRDILISLLSLSALNDIYAMNKEAEEMKKESVAETSEGASSLANVASGGTFENDVDSNITEDDGEFDYFPLKAVTEQRGVEAYRLLVSRYIYPEIRSNVFEGTEMQEFKTELNECTRQLHIVKFIKDKLGSTYDITGKNDLLLTCKVDNERIFTIESFNGATKVVLNYKWVNSDLENFGKVVSFAEGVAEDYMQLTRKYGELIFPVGVMEKNCQPVSIDNKIVKYSDGEKGDSQFPLVTMRMADQFVDLMLELHQEIVAYISKMNNDNATHVMELFGLSNH